MNEYIERLIRCGYTPYDAYMTYQQYLDVYDLDTFIIFLQTQEALNVGRV